VRALRLAWQGLQLFAVFLWELVVANLEQLRVILAPRIAVTPGWIRIRSDLETPAARALLGVMISLTPGSLTYEEGPTEDGSWILSLHVLDLRDEEQLVAQIRSRFESRLRAMERL
jgi:multisubunit Na+/H+ antiporter MnhE subunit